MPIARNALKLVFTIIIFGALFYFVDFENFVTTLFQANAWIIVAILVFFIAQAFNTLSLKLMLDQIGTIGFVELYKIYCVSLFSSYFAPGKMGEASLVYLLKKRGFSVGQATTVFFLHKVMSLVFLAVIGIYAAFIFLPINELIVLTVALAALFFVLSVMFFTQWGRTMLRDRILGKYAHFFSGFSDTLQIVLGNQKLLAANGAIIIVRWAVLQTTITFLLFLSFGQAVNPTTLFLINSASSVLSIIPLTLNGAGVREGSFVFLATKAGIDLNVAVVVVTVNLVLGYLGTGAVANLFFLKKMKHPQPKGNRE